jgi:hypothetical protein
VYHLVDEQGITVLSGKGSTEIRWTKTGWACRDQHVRTYARVIWLIDDKIIKIKP